MICPPCRTGAHFVCPEVARQENATLTATERAGSSWCDCQHEPKITWLPVGMAM